MIEGRASRYFDTIRQSSKSDLSLTCQWGSVRASKADRIGDRVGGRLRRGTPMQVHQEGLVIASEDADATLISRLR